MKKIEAPTANSHRILAFYYNHSFGRKLKSRRSPAESAGRRRIKFSFLTLCPFGLTNDPFPGQCARYIDANKNSLCDYSQSSSNSTLTNNYHLFPITIVLGLLYGISLLLVHKNFLTLATHKKIWNLLLLATFLISAILGILLILKINYAWQIPFPGSLFWHVEAGIAMTTISLFHILWHWRYFKSIFK